MKRKNLPILFILVLFPIGIDLLIRAMLPKQGGPQHALSDWFSISYVALLPFYAAWVLFVLAVLHLYNQYMRKSKFKKE